MQNKDNRKMIKWRPFKAIAEQEEALEKLLIEKNKIDKPILSEDTLEEMNYTFLKAKVHSLPIEIRYYERNDVFAYDGVIVRIDSSNRSLYLKDKQQIHHLYFDKIIGIKEKN